ncbi:MAG: NAD(P)-binding domain-containing protein [Deltaproteobacteria bacterium]|nr:NAD(P)-binding domain-containing protein [Deltaproteobacteria bacterium]
MKDVAPRIGLAGLGIMGSRLARRFLNSGYSLTVWNRTRAAAEAIAREGAALADTPSGLAVASDVVITCLADPPAVQAVALGEAGLLAGDIAAQLKAVEAMSGITRTS